MLQRSLRIAHLKNALLNDIFQNYFRKPIIVFFFSFCLMKSVPFSDFFTSATNHHYQNQILNSRWLHRCKIAVSLRDTGMRNIFFSVLNERQIRSSFTYRKSNNFEKKQTLNAFFSKEQQKKEKITWKCAINSFN